MEIALALCVIVGLLWAGSGMVFSRIARSGSDMLAFIGATTLISMTLSWGVTNWRVIGQWHCPRLGVLVALMLAAGVLNAVYQQLLLVSMRNGHNAIAWTIAQSAMVTPFVCGVLFWHDVPAPLKIAGILCLIASVATLGGAKMSGSEVGNARSWLPLVLAMFFAVGVSQTIFTIPSRWTGWIDPGRLRLPLSFAGALLLNGGAALVRRAHLSWQVAAFALLSASLTFIAQRLLFAAMDQLARGGLLELAYPLAAGVCIVGFALFSAFVLKETYRRVEVFGIALGLLGIACLL
ncbi:MAG: hypothetical protein P4L33_04925 [Capsulimonadaceae bacterium]|nr:hypothetical protein [Capsulimonadaceae bacterium]